MRDRLICADCAEPAPETESEYTLIGGQFGWRLVRVKTASGAVEMVWHCPKCWAKQKQSSVATTIQPKRRSSMKIRAAAPVSPGRPSPKGATASRSEPPRR